MIRALGASFVLIFGFDPGSLHRALKALGISWVIGMSFVPTRWLSVGFWMEAGCQRDQTMIRSLELSAPPHPTSIFQRGERVGNWVNDPLIKPMWWSFHKNPKSTVFRELLGWWAHPHTGRVAHSNSTGTEAPALGTLPDLALCTSLSISFMISFII